MARKMRAHKDPAGGATGTKREIRDGTPGERVRRSCRRTDFAAGIDFSREGPRWPPMVTSIRYGDGSEKSNQMVKVEIERTP